MSYPRRYNRSHDDSFCATRNEEDMFQRVQNIKMRNKYDAHEDRETISTGVGLNNSLLLDSPRSGAGKISESFRERESFMPPPFREKEVLRSVKSRIPVRRHNEDSGIVDHINECWENIKTNWAYYTESATRDEMPFDFFNMYKGSADIAAEQELPNPNKPTGLFSACQSPEFNGIVSSLRDGDYESLQLYCETSPYLPCYPGNFDEGEIRPIMQVTRISQFFEVRVDEDYREKHSQFDEQSIGRITDSEFE